MKTKALKAGDVYGTKTGVMILVFKDGHGNWINYRIEKSGIELGHLSNEELREYIEHSGLKFVVNIHKALRCLTKI